MHINRLLVLALIFVSCSRPATRMLEMGSGLRCSDQGRNMPCRADSDLPCGVRPLFPEGETARKLAGPSARDEYVPQEEWVAMKHRRTEARPQRTDPSGFVPLGRCTWCVPWPPVSDKPLGRRKTVSDPMTRKVRVGKCRPPSLLHQKLPRTLRYVTCQALSQFSSEPLMLSKPLRGENHEKRPAYCPRVCCCPFALWS